MNLNIGNSMAESGIEGALLDTPVMSQEDVIDFKMIADQLQILSAWIRNKKLKMESGEKNLLGVNQPLDTQFRSPDYSDPMAVFLAGLGKA